jgi:hypothetical protein
MSRRQSASKRVRLLTIAGSDSGGGAGIQADLKTFAAFGGYGMSAVTAVTAQNTQTVRALALVPPALVSAQIAAVAEDLGIDAAKTGMLGSTAIVRAVAGGPPPCDSTPGGGSRDGGEVRGSVLGGRRSASRAGAPAARRSSRNLAEAGAARRRIRAGCPRAGRGQLHRALGVPVLVGGPPPGRPVDVLASGGASSGSSAVGVLPGPPWRGVPLGGQPPASPG